MKKSIILILTLTLTLFSCSSDDDGAIGSEFAMTAKINGDIFKANNPFGTNDFSSTNIYTYFPTDDFVMFQGRSGGILGNPEINIWLKRNDIAVGTYTIGEESFSTTPSHFINLIDNTNQISEYTKGGVITITEVNTSSKIIVGTFEFTTVDSLSDPSATIDFNVTEGTFRYKYE